MPNNTTETREDEEDQRYMSRLMRSIALSLSGEPEPAPATTPPPVPARPPKDASSEPWLNATLVSPTAATFEQAAYHSSGHQHTLPPQQQQQHQQHPIPHYHDQHQLHHQQPYTHVEQPAQVEYKKTHARSTTQTIELELSPPQSPLAAGITTTTTKNVNTDSPAHIPREQGNVVGGSDTVSNGGSGGGAARSSHPNRLSIFLRELDESVSIESLSPESEQAPVAKPGASLKRQSLQQPSMSNLLSTSPPSSPPQPQHPASAALVTASTKLRRSSQLFPLQQGSSRQLRRQSHYGADSGGGLSSLSPVLSKKHSGDQNKTVAVIPGSEELKRLGLALKRKKEYDLERRASVCSTVSTSSLGDEVEEREIELEMEKRDQEKRQRSTRPGVLTRACGCIHLGFAAFMICTIMLVYNSVFGALVLDASRYPTATNGPIFIFAVLYLFTAALAFPGVISLYLVHRHRRTVTAADSSVPSPIASRFPAFLFRTFHWLYLTTVLLKLTAMLAWLGVNKLQTGQWDHIRLPQSAAHLLSPTTIITQEEPSVLKPLAGFSFEALVGKQDPMDANLWILNPAGWIVGFLAVFAVEVYFWICLWAYGRRYLLEREKTLVFAASSSSGSNKTMSEKTGGYGSNVHLVSKTPS